MGNLIFDQTDAGDYEEYKISGTIDEQSDFASLPKPKKKVHLDLVGLEAINSVGIREWIQWMQLWLKQAKVVFQWVPRVIIEQMNLVAEFLPEGAKIESFFVPYYCESCGNRSYIIMELSPVDCAGAGRGGVSFNNTLSEEKASTCQR